MEPDVSMETGSEIRVAVLPIGGAIPRDLLRDYVSMLARHTRVELSSISSFYVEHQKSPFAHQPWDTGALRIQFVVGGAPPSPWEDFQSNRKVLAVVGVCHCPSSPDLGLVADQFAAACKGYTSALVERCFAFCPSDAQLEDKSNKENNVILFPPSDRQAQELHMLTMVQDLAASLLMEFEKWVLRAESAGTILKTPLDSQSSLSSEEFIKAKKKRLGRAQKTIGDYCLLAGSPVDANAHYTTAIELARLTGDVFWHAGALEGSVSALLVDRMDLRDPTLEEEVKYRYYSVVQLYRRAFLQDNAQRVSTVSFELEAALKLARYLCRRELSKEVVDLLMGAADGAKSLIDASDRLILYVEIARLFGMLGYHRKAAFFSRQVAQLYLQQDNANAAVSAMQVLSITSKAYQVQSRRADSNSSVSPNGLGSGHSDVGKMHLQSIVSLFESQWNTLQMVVLREILMSSVRAGVPLAAWSAAARLLRSYYPLITPAGQSGLASSLTNSAERLPPGTRCADPALPFIRHLLLNEYGHSCSFQLEMLHSFPIHPSQVDIVKRNPGKEEWWLDSAPSGPFIYTPFSKGGPNDGNKQDLTWIVGEPVQILVELANPCGFDLTVDSIYLSVHSVNFDVFPLSDVDNLLLGAAQGLVLSDPFRCCGSGKLKNASIPNISVVPALPLLVSHVVGGDGAAILYEGEIRDIWLSLTNAGTVPIEQAHISLSGKHQDSVISIAYETLRLALPLKPGAEVTIPVTIKAWQLSLVDSDHAMSKNAPLSTGKMSKEGNGPLLLVYYAGPLEPSDPSGEKQSPVPPGRRLVVPLHVCVLQGLRFVRARLLSMEIPAHVSETLPKPLENGNSFEVTPDFSEHKNDRLIRIDPYRGSWGLRLLELELSNPTDVAFEVSVLIQLEKKDRHGLMSVDLDSADMDCHKTRIDRDYSARVLIPLEHFKLPIIDGSFFAKDAQTDNCVGKVSNTGCSERNTKAELDACINNLVSKIKVRWQSGRNSCGELNIKDAIQAALQTSVMDVLLPDPLTFGFRLRKKETMPNQTNPTGKLNGFSDEPFAQSDGCNLRPKGSILAHEMTPMEILVRNNTKEMIKMNLSITCRDVAGENCVEGDKATVLWAGVLSGIELVVPPLQEITHPFSFYFLVPGEYTLLGAAVIDDATDILRTCARTNSAVEPIFCRGSPFHVHVVGTL
ncbi:hypothetical protein Taro_024515 [Colocasia esculenta]|uniref:Trafficking protein particle complex II-specific subunit 120 homolog n=1 Tax=Colocasia esculenta TaxID=4460 RepID=A0A843VDV9_COLES|nr:hypothetical protein [Colocasia esculenta]